MRAYVLVFTGLLFALLLAVGIAEAETVTHSTAEEFGGGMFDATGMITEGDDASLQLEALGIPHWEKVSPIEGRQQHGMAYDAEDEAIVVFGGYTYSDSMELGDTWVYRISTGEWECMNPTTSPSPRHGHKMVYDAANDRIVLFGGVNYMNYVYHDETWTYDLDRNRWTELDTLTAPEARIWHSMVYDSINERVMLFGGYQGDSPYYMNDTWTFETATETWTHVATETAPSIRYYAMACFDDLKGVMVLFGGYIDVSPYRSDETWEFNASSMIWTEAAPSSSPVGRYGGTLVNLPGTGRSLLFGGYVGTSPFYRTAVWWYNSSSSSWSRTATNGPSGRLRHGMVYSPAAERFMLFGGRGYSVRNDLWGFDPGSEEWELLGADAPIARQGFGFVHDEVNDRFILFGGYDWEYFNDTWAYDAGAKEWSLIETASPPEARYEFGMVYDSTNEVIVLFGGQSRSTQYLGDTWEFDVTTDTWTRTSTSGPTARKDHAMAYDPGADRTVLFGGRSSSVTYRTDTMEYVASSNSWYSGGTGPAGRRGHAMAYLGSTGTVVLFGGYGSSGRLDDTQEYTTSSDTWSSKTTATTPYKRYGHSLAYDPSNERVYIFGGRDVTNLNDTYYYYASGSNRYWSKRNSGIQPDGRYGFGMAFDTEGTCVLVGGYAAHFMDDVWHLTSGSSEWRLDTPPSRLKSYDSDLMYDPVNREFIKFGNGMSYSNLMWHISPEDGTFSVLGGYYTSYAPVPVTQSHCAISPMTSELLIFGGRYRGDGVYREQNRTWLRSLERSIWDEVSEDLGPHFLRYTTIEFDRDNNRAVLFGGYYYDSGAYYLNDTWLFDPYAETWSQASPTNAPAERYGNAMAYDTVNRRVIVHGGYLESGSNKVSGETWAYDLENDDWVQLSDGPALYHHAAAFDSTRGKLFVWGGLNPSRPNAKLWAYDAAEDVWTELEMSHRPSKRYWTDMAYDPVEDIFLMHGGYYYDGMDTYIMSDIWRLIPDANEKNGIYTSAPIGPENGDVQWGSLSWSGGTPDVHTTLRAQIAADDDGVSGQFVGPDGTPDTYFTVSSGEMIHPGTISRFLRYRLYLETTHAGRTPEITSVSVTYETVTTPTVTLHSPNGGEDLMESGSHIVTWTGDGDLNATPVQLHYSTDGGVSWTLTGSWIANTGHYNWSVPSVETATGLVRVSVTDVYGNTVSDVSDMTFAIDPPANWQLPGTGGTGTTGDDTGDDGPSTSGEDGRTTENSADVTPLWIAIAFEGAAVLVLSVVVVTMMVNRERDLKRRKR